MGLFGRKPGMSVMPMQGVMGGFQQANPQQFMPQIDPQTGSAIQQFATMPAPKRKGLFGGDVAGGLGNLASGFAKAQAYIDGDWGAAEGIGQSDRAAQLAEQQRRASLEDWMFQQRWKLENEPKNPYRWEANDGSLMELGPNGPRVVYEDPNPKMNFIPDGQGGGQWVAVPRTMQQPMPMQAPQPMGLGNGDKPNWGALGQGRPTPSASGPFRR